MNDSEIWFGHDLTTLVVDRFEDEDDDWEREAWESDDEPDWADEEEDEDFYDEEDDEEFDEEDDELYDEEDE